MSKTLKVIIPIFSLDEGDILTLSKSGDLYVCEDSRVINHNGDAGEDVKTSYSATFSISASYAEALVKEGFLAPVTEGKDAFVNIFDEIETLLHTYEKRLNDVKNDKTIIPCVKVEQTTVYTNLISLLNHLKSLKK